MEIRSVCIVGLGLIGGSIAKAIKKIDSSVLIVGIDTEKEALKSALDEGTIDKVYTDINKSIYDSDVVFVCTPVDVSVKYIEEIGRNVKPECIITDTGSTKRNVIERIEEMPEKLNFIGGHPMCGSEKSGYEASTSHLFENAYYILTPCSKTAGNALKVMENIIIEIGGIPVIIDSIKHDFVTGAISHFPHIVSAGLVNLIKELDYGTEYMHKLAAGGFKDITRIASSNPQMWKNIVLNNREHITEIVEKFLNILEKFNEWLNDQEEAKISGYFQSAKEYRDTFSSRNIGLLNPFNDITVDIEDKPGEIGRIATILGEHGINIKNLNVSNSRESDSGCLRISLPDIDSVDKAYELLKDNRYRVYKV